jgi:hypothetical protein
MLDQRAADAAATRIVRNKLGPSEMVDASG